jgi:DNA-binding beta-propeller fold protein YncE
LSGASKFALVLSALLLSCASGPRRDSFTQLPPRTGDILSLRLIASAGPAFDNASFVDPAAVTVNDLGDFFVSDKASNEIFKFSSELALLAREGGSGSSEGSFNRPLGMASDAALNLFVADSYNRRLVVLDRSLRFVKTIDGYFDDNDAPFDFNLPGDLSFDNQGNLWVADDTRALKLDPFQNLVLEISDKSPGYVIIGRISSLDVSRAGQVAIADIGNHKMLLLSLYGSYVGEYGVPMPGAVAISGNEIWIADPAGGKISVYDSVGNLLFAFGGDEPGFRPAWLAFDPSGRLAVIDRGTRKLKIFEVIKGAARESK